MTTCGAPTKAGSPCRRRVPTDGGRCPHHPDVVESTGQQLVRQITATFVLTAAEEQLLDQAAATLDAISTLDGQLATDGVMVAGSKGQPVLHPAVAELRLQRLTLARLLTGLDLPEEPSADDQHGQARTSAARALARARWGVRHGVA